MVWKRVLRGCGYGCGRRCVCGCGRGCNKGVKVCEEKVW